MKPLKICFFAPVTDRIILDRVEFYKQDIDILRGIGFSVTLATRWSEIPWNADFYFVWWWTWAFLPLIKAKLTRKPVLITGVFDYRWPVPGLDYAHRPFWQRALLRCALTGADSNVFVSQLEYDSIRSELPVRWPHYIPLTLDTRLYSPANARLGNTILTVAWLQQGNTDRKCIPQIIRAVPSVLQQYPAARFIIAGEQGTAYPELVKLAESLGVRQAIDFIGVVLAERKIALMQSCGVYLQPSLYEGFGLAILEAMSCGAPVVSSPVGAVPEVVGDTGLLVDGQSPPAIAAAVNRLLADAALREKLGRRARERAVTMFPLERRRHELTALIQKLLDKSER